MKSRLLLFLFFIFPFLTLAQKLELNGRYQGKNIYIQNPAAPEGEGFCTNKVLVNGKEMPFSEANAYEIRLDTLGLVLGDTVKVEIFHKPDCKPKVISDHSSPRNTFDVVSIAVDSSGTLWWTAKNEGGKFTFVVEQFRWNKWIKVGEVVGEGGMQENSYSCKIAFHSGKNQFRVKQVASGTMRVSQAAEYLAPELGVKILGSPHKQWEAIHFSQKTMYELYDRKGNIVKKGEGVNIGIKGLEQNFYYLNYDNKTETITIWSK